MRLRSTLFGFGAGLITMSFVLLTAYRYDTRRDIPAIQEDGAIEKETLSDDEIIDKALALGMEWPSEPAVLVVEPVSEAEIIQRAFTLGMTFKEMQADIQTETEDALAEDTPDELAVEVPKKSEDTVYVTVTIRPGSYAAAITEQLYKAGVITDKKAFNKYMDEQNKTRTIRSGTFKLPVNGSVEKIASLITVKK